MKLLINDNIEVNIKCYYIYKYEIISLIIYNFLDYEFKVSFDILMNIMKR